MYTYSLLTMTFSTFLFSLPNSKIKEKTEPMALPAQYYVIIWITVSCSMILFNKSVLSYMGFDLPIFLTFFHMLFSTIATQVLPSFFCMPSFPHSQGLSIT